MAEPEAPPKDDAEDSSTASETSADAEIAGVDGRSEPSPSADDASEADVNRAKSGQPDPSEEPEPSPDDGVGDEGAHGPRWLPLAIAFALPVLFFFVLPPLTKSGLWDPYELNVADLARRVALNLHGATALALEGADNSLPHLNDLGRPQLPFTSIALGFKIFGLHECCLLNTAPSPRD